MRSSVSGFFLSPDPPRCINSFSPTYTQYLGIEGIVISRILYFLLDLTGSLCYRQSPRVLRRRSEAAPQALVAYRM